MKKGGADVSTAPVYYDWQAMLEHDVTSSTTARVLFWGSDDRLALTVNNPDAGDPVGGAIDSRVHFWRVQGRLDSRVSDRVRWINTVSYGLDGTVAKFSDYFGDVAWHPLQARSDLRVKLGDAVTFVTGVDVLYETYDVTYKFPPFPGDGIAQGPLFARPANVLSGSGSIFRPGAYAMLEVTPFEGLRLLPGFRADYAKDTGTWTGDPRLAARWDVASSPRTTFKGGVGLFHQPPQPKESVAPFGQAGLSSNRAIHYSLGVERELTHAVELSLEGFYKDLRSLVVERAAENSSRNGFSYANAGSGRVMGLEALLRYKSDGRFFGWLAYTLSKSERRDDPSQPLHVFQYDQTHILTALGSYQLGRGWEVGARFRYVTGSPYTPRSGGLVDLDAGAYAPISGASFSARDGAFHSLDVRVEKRWDLGAVKLAAYLDVHNAYNRTNPEGRAYNYDFTQSKAVAGLPLLPIVGIRGEL
jgi:hypothetical protein